MCVQDAAGNVPAISGQMLTFTATVKDRYALCVDLTYIHMLRHILYTSDCRLADETQIFLSFILRTLVLSSEVRKYQCKCISLVNSVVMLWTLCGYRI